MANKFVIMQDGEPNAGARLKYEREKQNVSVSEISQQLRLPERIIHAIENDQRDLLPDSEVYVRGYIRAYCQLLKIPPDELLSDFSLHSESQGNEDFVFTTSEKAHQFIRVWGSLAVVSGIFILVGLWWMKHYLPIEEFGNTPAHYEADGDQPEPDAMPMIEEQPPQLEIRTPDDVPPQNTQNTRDDSSVEREPAPPTEYESAVDAMTTTGAESELMSEDEPPAAAGELMSEDEPPAAAGELMSEGEPPAAAGELMSEGELPADNFVQLAIYTSDVCWIRIIDSRGETLLHKEVPARFRTTLEGQAPFDVGLGRASVVALWVNDELYDLNQHRISSLDTAFFELTAP